MSESVNIIRNAITQIKQSMKAEAWLEAHRACLEILRFDPDNLKIIRLKNRIERIVRKKNKKAIIADLKKISHFLKEKKYREYYDNIIQLNSFAEEYPSLKKKIDKATKLYSNVVSSEVDKYYLEQTNLARKKEADRDFSGAIGIYRLLQKKNINPGNISNEIRRLEREWVTWELEAKKEIIKSDNFEQSIQLLNELKLIDGKNKKLLETIKQVKKKYQTYKIKERYDKLNELLLKSRKLYKAKQFQDAIAGCNEIILHDPSNKKAKKLLRRAEKHLIADQTKNIISDISSSQKNREKEYREHREDYIKI